MGRPFIRCDSPRSATYVQRSAPPPKSVAMMKTFVVVAQGHGECCDYGVASSDSNKQWHIIKAENENDLWDKLIAAESWEDYQAGDEISAEREADVKLSDIAE